MEIPEFKDKCDKAIAELLPHRSPFLFVDRLIASDETGCVEIPASKFIPGKKFKVSFEYDKPKKTELK